MKSIPRDPLTFQRLLDQGEDDLFPSPSNNIFVHEDPKSKQDWSVILDRENCRVSAHHNYLLVFYKRRTHRQSFNQVKDKPL